MSAVPVAAAQSVPLRQAIDAFLSQYAPAASSSSTPPGAGPAASSSPGAAGHGQLHLGVDTVVLLKQVISLSTYTSLSELLRLVRQHGRLLADRLPGVQDFVSNLTRRVLKLVREEWSSCGDDPPESLARLMRHEEEEDQPLPDQFQARLFDSMDELVMELETSSDEISRQALEHIHANEIILTFGYSRTVELFLKHAAKERQFQVMVAECAPGYSGQSLAASLARSRIQTTVITDSAVFAMMSRANKVIIGTNAILANGGLKSVAGGYTVALAAKHHSIPLYVCTSMFKLTPQNYMLSSSLKSGERLDRSNQFASPQELLSGMDGAVLSKVRVCAPVYEYVPPELVTLFISNISGHGPSYFYRLLSEFYHPDDYDLSED